MTTMHVELVSPERVLFSGEATMVIVRTLGGGDIAFLPGHAPFLGALGEWPAQLHLDDGTVRYAAIHGGFVEVSDNTVAILADVAEFGDDVDTARAQAALERAERSGADDEAAAAAARRARSRLSAASEAAGRASTRSH